MVHRRLVPARPLEEGCHSEGLLREAWLLALQEGKLGKCRAENPVSPTLVNRLCTFAENTYPALICLLYYRLLIALFYMH